MPGLGGVASGFGPSSDSASGSSSASASAGSAGSGDWYYKQAHSRSILELKVLEVLNNCLITQSRDALASDIRVNKHRFTAYKNHSFYKMAELLNRELNYQDRKTIKKHMANYITPDSSSGNKDDPC